MVWIYLALGVGLIGLVLIGWYLFVLYRKLGALLGELGVLADQAGQVLDLVEQIEIPDDLDGRYDATFSSDLGTESDSDLTADAWVAAGARPRRRT